MLDEATTPAVNAPVAADAAASAAANAPEASVGSPAGSSSAPAPPTPPAAPQAVLLTGVPAMMPAATVFNLALHQQHAAAHFGSLVSHQQQQVAAQQQLRLGQIQLQIQQQAAQQAQAQRNSIMQAAAAASGGGSQSQFTFPPILMGLEVCGSPGVLQPAYYQAYAHDTEKHLLCSTCQLTIPPGDVMLSVANLTAPSHANHTVAPDATATVTVPTASEHSDDTDDDRDHVAEGKAGQPPGDASAPVVPEQAVKGPTFFRHLECAQLHHLAHEPDNSKIHGFDALTSHQQMIVHHRLNFVRAKALPSSTNSLSFVPSGNIARDATALLAKAGATTAASGLALGGLGVTLPTTPSSLEQKRREQLELLRQRQRPTTATKRARASGDEQSEEQELEGAAGDDLDEHSKLELHLLRERLTERELMMDARSRGDLLAPEFGFDGESVKPRRKRAKKDPLAPKRPASNYMFWCMYRRPQLKSASPDVNSNVLMRTMALEWKSMVKTPEVMRQWDEMHEKDQARYRRQMAEWRATGSYTPETLDLPAIGCVDTQLSGASAAAAVAGDEGTDNEPDGDGEGDGEGEGDGDVDVDVDADGDGEGEVEEVDIDVDVDVDAGVDGGDDVEGEAEGATHLETAELGRPSSSSEGSDDDQPAPRHRSTRTTRSRHRAVAAAAQHPSNVSSAATPSSKKAPAAAAAAAAARRSSVSASGSDAEDQDKPASTRVASVRQTRASRASAAAAANKEASLTDLLVAVSQAD